MSGEKGASIISKKDLGLVPAMALVVGMVIGSGIFMKHGKVIAAAGDSTMGLVAWLLGGVITMAAGLTIAELGAQIPRTGGLYAYLDEVYGRFWGYLFGWVQALIYGPATSAALGLYFAALFIPFFGLADQWRVPTAFVTVLFLSAVNAFGSKYGGWVQSLSTVAKLAPIVLIAIVGLWKGDGQVLGMQSGLTESAGMGAAILATLWAYDGWIGVGYVAGEMNDPAKQLPRAIVFGLGIVMLAYLFVNIAMLHVLPAAQIVALGNQAAGAIAGRLFGEIGGKLVNIGILISVFGALNGYILTSARVPYAMALQGLLPGSGWLARLHARSGAPVNAIIQQLIMTALLMMLGDPDRLTDISMFIIEVFYILGFIAVFRLRRIFPSRQRPYSVPWYPFIPGLAVVGAVYIVISTILANPIDTIYALGLTLAGVPLFWLLNKEEKAPQLLSQTESTYVKRTADLELIDNNS
ncbi:amino acid permease-associated region [Thermosinus carboxydivorans Nor1]|uniref:Amino acid permease-associated region n=1 Tax=Thermosinus carboxydivorans Nor1 TaxID=401526 RepID=A1HRZ3_9FIRM|nr:amino acid permease [Thermosinus carboxydivorans]EAX47171.1 amino acid permease-associated region [Thermosinus carboxydivorans Nor1]